MTEKVPTQVMTDYEYAVWANLDDEIHRGPWSEKDCIDWIQESRDFFPVGAKIDKLWSVRRRPAGKWETYG